MSLSIKIENLSKVYRLGEISTGTISHDIQRWIAKTRGKEDPYMKIGQTNDRALNSVGSVVYSLKDISFEVPQGESLAIIGRNGAGKSTLLKVLSKITSPTSGSVKIKGKVASLLEVGTGFHPELTGRDNIFLNGAILGMRRKEIAQKLDEIIAFSGVGNYIDTPVKRYSSGMYVRLAFAVAAHLEPDILIVDEVLAVGDAEFQKKCLGKMKHVSGEGRTVIFVSHNMAAVKSLCTNAVLLKHGEMAGIGPAADMVSTYLGMDNSTATEGMLAEPISAEDVVVSEIMFQPPPGQESGIITEGKGAELHVKYNIKNDAAKRYHFTFHLNDENGDPIFGFSPSRDNIELKNGSQTLVCRFPDNFFNVGSYYLTLLIVQDTKKVIHVEKDVSTFSVAPKERAIGQWYGREPGFLIPSFNWYYL